jgi:NDP-sugar pyrophosphorylase family protein
MAVVVDLENRLRGTLTDGDIRRHLLAGGSLEDLALLAMNATPIVGNSTQKKTSVQDLMRMNNIIALPIVDFDNRYIDLVHLFDLVDSIEVESSPNETFSFAVIMAGGEGSRLRPLTDTTPKPMIKIGEVPLIEHQVRNIASAGIGKIYISINYLGEIIEEYLGCGEKFGIEIHYLREEIKLGTAGPLSLLPETPTKPILVINGDIFTASDFNALFSFHASAKSELTIGAIDYRMDIPFGVINMNGDRVIEILEKPSQRYLCSAGIYAISPRALQVVPRGSKYNMTELISENLNLGIPVSAFPIHELWSDIGTKDDLEKARKRFIKNEIPKEKKW